MFGSRALFAVVTASLACLVPSGSAWAAAFQIEARTEAQAYEIRSYRESDPTHPVLLPRRRIVQYLGLDAYELVTGQDLGFESDLRLYEDFGMPRGEANRLNGLRSEDADLLYANVHYRTGGLELRLGRQLYVDVMDMMAFDGVKARYTLSSGIGAEAYAGLWVKAASFLGSSVYQLDGTREVDPRPATAPGVNPVLGDLEPLYGAKLFAQGFAGFSGALAYRHSFLDGKVTYQRAAAELRYGRGKGLNGFAGVDFDLLMLRLAQLRAELRYDGELFAVSGEVLRQAPVLSAESIWYYFATAPRDEANLRFDLFPVGPLRFYVRGTATRYNLEINTAVDPDIALDPALQTSLTYGGSAGAALRLGRLRSALDVTYRRGPQERQLWIDATAGYVPEGGRFTLDGRISVANVNDGYNPYLRGTFFGAQAWASYLLSRAARVSFVLEENVNPTTLSEAKAFLLLDLKASL